VVHISRGYSRDGKAELNQVALELIHEHQAKLPVALQVLDGKQNDKKTMSALTETHVAQLRQVGIGILVKDSAGYSDKALKAHEEAGLKWIMRVPATVAEAKLLVETTAFDMLQPLMEGYHYKKIESDYAGIRQRWLVIHSQSAKARAKKTVARQALTLSDMERKAFEKLTRQDFACKQDAERALEAFKQELKVLTVHDTQVVELLNYGKRGRPSQDSVPASSNYQLRGAVAAPLAYYQEQLIRASLFILASNELDAEELSDQELLSNYKAQAIAERGFRFLKDPMFLASTLFLKKVERVMALLMVMTVCLLVYAALEHRIRSTLAWHEATLPDQKGKATQRPTTRWVFEMFLDVHLLFIVHGTTRVLTMNLKNELRMLLELLGPSYQQAYP
jgi:transposase